MGFSGQYYLQGDVLHDCTAGSYRLIHQNLNVYEVIRIIDGIPLFFEKHCTRLLQSAALIGINISIDELVAYHRIKELAQINKIQNGNIKIVLQYPGSSNHMFTFFIPHHYPSAKDYDQGVDMVSLSAERDNPKAKVSNPELRARADEIIRQKKITEVLLVDHKTCITEGSRSNIFLIREDTVFTPTSEAVLPGITRETIIEICAINGIKFQESQIRLSELGTFQGAFLTGTSPKVLPVRSIDDHNFQVNDPIISKIIEKYDQIINDYFAGLQG